MKNLYKLIMFIVGLNFILLSSFAQGVNEEVPPRYGESSFIGAIKSFFSQGEIKNFLSVTLGYDSNIYLDDKKREGDPFTQIVYQTTLTSSLTDKTDGILEYELMSLLYPDAGPLDMVSNYLRIGANFKLNEETTLYAGYHFGIVDYVNTGDDDFLDHRLKIKVKQKLPKKFFHSLSYTFRFKDYNDQKVTFVSLLPTTKTREDVRNSVEYAIGKYFKRDVVKMKFEYYYNNSNYPYLAYYDYDSYRLTLSCTHLFNKKLFGHFSFSRQIRDYTGRLLTVDLGSKEWDRTYVISSGLYYILNKSLTIGFNYTYRQNWSNEPTSRYSGSVISVGTYWRF